MAIAGRQTIASPSPEPETGLDKCSGGAPEHPCYGGFQSCGSVQSQDQWVEEIVGLQDIFRRGVSGGVFTSRFGILHHANLCFLSMFTSLYAPC